MKPSVRKSTCALLVAALMALVTFVAATTAHAQISVTNWTGCTVQLTMVDAAGNGQGPFLIPGGGGPIVIPTPPGYIPAMVLDANGAWLPILWPPPPVVPAHPNPTPPPPAGSGCTGCMRLPAPGVIPPFCCGAVCYDAALNTITIWPCTGC